MKIFKKIIPLIFLTLILYMIFSPKVSLTYAADGLKLWYFAVVPSLLPFLIFSDILIQTGFVSIASRIFSPITKYLFKTSPESSAAYILGIISGYPIGAKATCDMYKASLMPRGEAQRLISFSNNCGPMFMMGTVAFGMYGGMKQVGFLLLTCHYAGSLTLGIISGLKIGNIKNSKKSYRPAINNFDLGNVIASSVQKATSLIIIIGGFIILFSVIIGILKDLIFNTNSIISAFILGTLEMTNGVNILSHTHCSLIIKMILSSFLLGFGGISVSLQVITIIKSCDLSIKKYIKDKLLHGIISSIYCLIFFNLFIDKTTISTLNTANQLGKTSPNLYILNNLCIVVMLISIGLMIFRRKRII